MSSLINKIALTFISGVGSVTARNLISYCGSVEQIFSESKKNLIKVPGVREKIATSIAENKSKAIERAAKEVAFIEKNNISALFYTDSQYPFRLKNCLDSPIVLYCKSNDIACLNEPRILSIVGTRKATDYGKKMCEKLASDLVKYNPNIVSGLAHGIDTQIHKHSIKLNIKNICVVAHGLDMTYPAENIGLAHKIEANGAIISEFPSGTLPDKENFPKRNRIIAGISQATVLVESALKGGAMITASLAIEYNRELFCIPGQTDSYYSGGCNYLIKKQYASLIESGDDIAEFLLWEKPNKNIEPVQKQLIIELNAEEETLYSLLNNAEALSIDYLSFYAKLPIAKTSATLLNLEFKGLIKALPGNRYKRL